MRPPAPPMSRHSRLAIEKAGSLDPKGGARRHRRHRASIASTPTSAYAENGQIVLPQIVIQIQNGKLVPIYTDKFIDKPHYPIPAWDKRG